MGKKRSFSTEKWARIVALSNLKFSVRQIEKKVKVCKIAVSNAITKNKIKVFSINQSMILFLPKSALIENKFDSSGQKKETMAKRYTLIHAHEKNLD